MRHLVDPLLGLPRAMKRAIAIGIDLSLCIITVWIAYYLRLGEWVALNDRPLISIALAMALAVPIFTAFGLYHVVFRHAGRDAIASCAIACAIYGLAYAAIISAYGFNSVPRTVGLIQPVLLFLSISLWRVGASYLLTRGVLKRVPASARSRVLIYGAGIAGQQLARVLSNSREMQVFGFVDDDQTLRNSRIQGLRVFDGESLEQVVKRHDISEVLLAVPSASRTRRAAIIDKLSAFEVEVRILPDFIDLAHGTVQASDLREVTIEDLLQRDPVPYDPTSLHEHVTGSVVLVSGAGGSIGAELCRQILALKPEKLLLIDNSEHALYSIHGELSQSDDDVVVPLLASVVDRTRIDRILAAWRPSMIFHAAAYKHVPLVEHNPLEGMRNNVIGTAVMAEAAAEHNVRDFVLVSTDKAVRPTNIMGATKRLAEIVLQAINGTERGRGTCYSMVRFGNVLDSSGSVVPLFRRQIRAGGPITLTHPDITRYFMTIPEAVHLVLQASAMAEGGEVFVLDMGQPVKIRDLAINMVRLSGLSIRDSSNPDGDIEIAVVGLRPGEKLYEELLIGNNPTTTRHPRIMKATENSLPWSQLGDELVRLENLIDRGGVDEARTLLQHVVGEFTATSEIVDWVWTASSSDVGPSSANVVASRAPASATPT